MKKRKLSKWLTPEEISDLEDKLVRQGKCTRGTFRCWKNDVDLIGLATCIIIEKLTQGKVKRQALRPEIFR